MQFVALLILVSSSPTLITMVFFVSDTIFHGLDYSLQRL